MYKKLMLIGTALLLFSQMLFAQDNLIKNGQFVQATDGWQILLDDANQPIKAHIEQSASYQDYGLADNFIGINFVELDENSAIQQKITTKQETLHLLSFAYAHRPAAGKKQLIVAVNGKAIFTKTVNNNDDTGVFHYKNIFFTANAPTSKIAFYTVSLSGDGSKGVLLTDIKCSQPNAIDLEKHKRAIKF